MSLLLILNSIRMATSRIKTCLYRFQVSKLLSKTWVSCILKVAVVYSDLKVFIFRSVFGSMSNDYDGFSFLFLKIVGYF